MMARVISACGGTGGFIGACLMFLLIVDALAHPGSRRSIR